MINRLIKEVPRAVVISVLIFLVLLLIRLITGNTIALDYGLLTNFGYTMLYGLSLYFANAFLFLYLDTIFATERFAKKRIIIGFVFSFLISVFVIFLLRIFEDVLIEGRTFAEFLNKESLSNYLVAIILTFIVTLSFHAFHFYKAYNESKVKEQKVIAGNANAQFESLKNQIDPHFLFNSLNVLSSLIEENPENAQRFTTSLSKIYRYVLEQKDKELVTVKEELTFAKTYMNLLKMRFENSISYELPEDFDNDEAKVVPLSLQLLLENTIKHNVVSEQKPLHIKIDIVDHYLIVENNLQIKEVLQDRKGVGLQNIVNRYALISERKVLIEEHANYFKIKIPILTKQIVTMDTQNIFNENNAYAKAKDRVEKLKGFYGNLASYCTVIPILAIINLNSGGFQWFWFPMMGWGMGVCFHAFETFGYGKTWEEKKIQEILNKQNSQNTKWK
ncbi:histidine kinase [Flavobacterium sp.]|uniref:histidine kinase n=1 Tax=Flavobacterium sp. TaxID=239 RepID=UPI00286A259A|nr:histidine kinase [Flavobacterium sp.]